MPFLFFFGAEAKNDVEYGKSNESLEE